MSFISRLEARARQADSLLCIGLDPHAADLPQATPAAARDFCLRLVDATASVAAAFKPNAAFFEALGPDGWALLSEVIAAVPLEIPVILDAKRGDIASTAQAYAHSAFRVLGASAVTLSPYLGHDSLEPFLREPEKGVFLLCKTSNPGSGDLQDLLLAGGDAAQAAVPRTVYESVALLARGWNRNDNLGLVAGATHPEALERVRRLAPELWILAPGVGAQGGDLRLALQAGLREDGSGLLVPVSRSISQAAHPAQAARNLRDEINQVRRSLTSQRVPAPTTRPASQGPAAFGFLADALLQAGCVRFGEFTLKSGLISPIYLDLRTLVSFPALLRQVAAAYVSVLGGLSFERLAALPYAALPIASAVSLQGCWPFVYPRKEAKDYGTKAVIEGLYRPGEVVVVIDDLATTGGSKFEAIEKLTSAGLQVKDVVVLVDRQSGAREGLEARGVRMHAVFTLSQLLDHWESSGLVPPGQLSAARRFLAENSGG